jgi:hypothetical protein
MQRQFLATLAVLVSSPIVFGAAGAQAQSPQAPMPNPQLSSSATARKAVSPAVAANYGKLPLSFEANQGQADSRVRFISRGSGYSLFLTDTAAVLALSKPEPGKQEALRPKAPAANPTALKKARLAIAAKTDVISMELAGAARSSRVAGDDQLRGTANYFLGNDPAKWRTNIPTYAKVKYSEVYPGVDLVYYGNQRQLEYDFLIAPGASAKPVKLRFAGASKLKLNADGDLTVVAKNGEIAFRKPVAYQEKNGRREPVTGQFTLLARNTVGFKLGDYDRSRELVIDPVLGYSTYLNPDNSLSKVAVDSEGEAYIVASGFVGPNFLPEFPLTYGAYSFGDGTISVLKLNPAGTAAVYSAAFGGTMLFSPGFDTGDSAGGIAVDSSGNAYITGQAQTSDFPTTAGAFQRVNKSMYSCSVGDDGNAFVLKLNSSGTALVYSTFIGGNHSEYGSGIAVDPLGDAYIAGSTASYDFPVTKGAFQTTTTHLCFNGTDAGFVAKFNPTGSALDYATYVSGTVGDYPTSMALDSSGNVYLEGIANSTDYPLTANPLETNPDFGGFLTKLNATGSALIYSTYFPTAKVAADASGNAYVAGFAYPAGVNLPTTKGAFQTTNDSRPAGFVAKVNPTGTALIYSTLLGGTDSSAISAIAVDNAGNAFVAGQTIDTDFPVTPDAFQKVNKGLNAGGNPQDGGGTSFLTEFNPEGSALIYSTYLGGSGSVYQGLDYGDTGIAVAIDSLKNAYVLGYANSTNFPVTAGAYQTKGGGNDSLTKFVFNGATATALTSDSNPKPQGDEVTFKASVSSLQGDSTPTGVMEFHIDGVLYGYANLDGSGGASYYTSSLATGAHAVEALYRGDASHAASSGFFTETITGPVAAPSFVPVGGTYKTSTVVTIADATARAVVHYTKDGSTPSASSPIYSAPLTISKPTTLKAIAIASGDTNSPVSSASYNFVSTAKPTTTSLISSVATVLEGDPVTLTATVKTTDNTTPTGTVTFFHGNIAIGSATLKSGVAVLTTTSLPTGLPSITAEYGGNATEAVSGSPAVVVEVNP